MRRFLVDAGTCEIQLVHQGIVPRARGRSGVTLHPMQEYHDELITSERCGLPHDWRHPVWVAKIATGAPRAVAP